MTGLRVIVTGSRYLHHEPVRFELNEAFDRLNPGDTLTVVHGACRTGADAAAALWIQHRQLHGDANVIAEPHPANWHDHHRAAGPIRNQAMVDAGADLCLAFLDATACRGTRDTIRRALAAGIPVQEVTAP